MVRDRLVQLEAPDDELAGLMHDFRELCVQQIAQVETAVRELRKERDVDIEHEIAILEDRRVVLEGALEHASRLLVH
jgi:hypothetical protein